MTNTTFNFGYSGGVLAPEFGLVILVGIFAAFVNFGTSLDSELCTDGLQGFAIQVGRARRKFGIEPPRMTETSLAKEGSTPNSSTTTELLPTAVGETPDEYRRYQVLHNAA